MSQVPARLVYTDSNNNEQVIGSFQPEDPTNGNISTFTIEEEGRNYKRVIIEGGPSLEDNMPVTLNDFGTSEPEIRVQIDSDLDGTWEQRLRVYPEESGTTNNRGRYKNKELWGFKKYYGEDSVNTGTVSNTDLTGAVQALLPTGYVAQYPGDITAPSIAEYVYKGSRQQGFNELQREYKHFIIFTDDTDANGDFIVKVQPIGYGSTKKSFVRGDDPYTYDYWKKNDLSNVVSRVNIIGKDSTGSTVNLTFQAGSDTGDPDVDTYLTGLPDPERKVFKRLHIDYTINSSTAQTIAENFLNPTGSEHGAIEAGLDPSSALNESVGVLDESRGIDDVYTVVKQKDFLHEGVTFYSFEFEHESTDEQRSKWREHDSERAKLYPSQATDVGQQSFTGDTGSAPSDTNATGGVNDNASDTTATGGVTDNASDTGVTGSISQVANADNVVVSNSSDSFSTTVDGNWTFVAGVSNVSNDAVFHSISAGIDNGNPQYPGIAVVRDNAAIMAYWSPNDIAAKDAGSLTGGTVGDSGYWSNSVTVNPSEWSGSNSDYSLYIYDKGGGSSTSTGGFTVQALSHIHDDSFATQDNLHPHGDDIDTQDNLHPHGDDIDTADNQHGGTGDATGQHGASGTTDSKTVNTATEEKTDR